MNGKQAKRLRRLAQAVTTGAPDRAYKHEPRGHRTFKMYDAAGAYPVTLPMHQTILTSTCTRAVYQRLKRGTAPEVRQSREAVRDAAA